MFHLIQDGGQYQDLDLDDADGILIWICPSGRPSSGSCPPRPWLRPPRPWLRSPRPWLRPPRLGPLPKR
jgi:hypothetical protein